jgi:hypothetical protein
MKSRRTLHVTVLITADFFFIGNQTPFHSFNSSSSHPTTYNPLWPSIPFISSKPLFQTSSSVLITETQE